MFALTLLYLKKTESKMLSLKVIDSISRNENSDTLTKVFKLRHKSFVERLGWDVTSCEGMEVDEFDDLNVSHIAMINEDEDVVGCWRALPTKGSYMLKDVFPQLLQGEDAPQQDEVWEISRFTVENNSSSKGANIVSSATLEMVKSFYYFGIEKNIKNYVLVTTVGCERILRLLGVKTRRMGAGRSIKIGVEKSVALWIDMESSFEALAA
ncbi:acyl-homoserine-lactone synthase [Microbulbifer sp. EKSA005]|uniref:acyl-homoserine-lactone synthase n=1 Tax=Microbulbifer sp. EKSA005 TaxID=3243364 RepID=UPI0040419DFE